LAEEGQDYEHFRKKFAIIAMFFHLLRLTQDKIILMDVYLLFVQGVDRRKGSKWTLGRLVVGVWSGFTWLRIGIVGGLL
jgi:hypothetical protein